MTKKERYNAFIEYFLENMPVAETELHYENTFQLMVAVILSAQCTDKRVNMITPQIFAKYPTIEEFAKAEVPEIFDLIKSCSYPNNKSKHLSGMAKMLVEKFNSRVPSSIDELQELPGVGRKTANVIASVAFDIPAMAVDTHVFRVANRIGLTRGSKSPLQTEKELVKYIPVHLHNLAHHWLILHGRYVCKARSPECTVCGLQTSCRYYSKLAG